jgi:hypothetical protein
LKGWYYIATYALLGRLIYVFWGQLTDMWGMYYHTWIGGLLFVIWMKLFFEHRNALFLVLSIVFGALLIWELTALTSDDYAQAINDETVAFCLFLLLLCSITIISLLPVKKWRKVKY